MGIDLYYFSGGAPSRATLMAAKSIGINVNVKVVNILEQEQMTPEYLKVFKVYFLL